MAKLSSYDKKFVRNKFRSLFEVKVARKYKNLKVYLVFRGNKFFLLSQMVNLILSQSI